MSNEFSVSVYSADDGEFLGSCDSPGTYPAIVVTVVQGIGFEQKDIVTVKRIIGDQQIKLALSDRISIPPCSLSVFVQIPPPPAPLPSPKLEPTSPQIPDFNPQPSASTTNPLNVRYKPAIASNVPSHPLVTIREAKLRDVFHDAMYIVERIEAGIPLLTEQEIFFRRRAAYYLGSICGNKYQPTKTERRDFMIAIVGPYGWDIDQLVSVARKRGSFDMACNNMTSSMTKNMGIQRRKRKRKEGEAGPSSKQSFLEQVDDIGELNAALEASEAGSDERRDLIAKTSFHRKGLAALDPFLMLQQYPDYLKDQNLAIYDFSQTAPGTSTFSHRITGPVYDYLSVLLQLNPDKPKLEVIFAISEVPSDADRKCHASLLMIYLTAYHFSLENVLSPFFYNDFKHISSISEAIKLLEKSGVNVPCIVRLAEPAEDPYYVVFRDVSLHVKGDLSVAVIVLFAFYQTFNAEYPKCLISMMRIVGELLGLKHSSLTPQETELVKSLNLA